MQNPDQPLMELRGVSKRFGAKPDLAARLALRARLAKPVPSVQAVDRVDLTIRKGEVLGLVGESGCGKSTLARIVADILTATEGEVFWRGEKRSAMSAVGRKTSALAVQMIFQNPMAALNPRMTIDEIIFEAPFAHGLATRSGRSDYVRRYLSMAGFDVGMKDRYPHEFSGGQRQRVNIARALAVQPEFLVCDESVAALDVSIQAQVINLFLDLRDRLDLTCLFVSHDLGVVEHISDRVAVMYLGRIIESAPVDALFRHSNHPYTKALLSEAPRIERGKRKYEPIRGELPSPLNPPAGCHFHPRCPLASDICRVKQPALREIAVGHMSACHLNDEPGIPGGAGQG